MLTKEYRIPLPLTRDEYKIAQLYMIAKKSRQESEGEGSGIEILVNEPYEDGPGPEGKGQYTRKVYHVGSHLPAWVKSLIPKSALSVEEEAWNAYPYTKTRFTCPFVEKFSIEIETTYLNDGGQQDNVFNLGQGDLKNREVDVIDIVNDQLFGADYLEEEDPKTFVSQKTSRGPLDENWISSYSDDCIGKPTPLSNGRAIMCAYKLCKVEFKYWGMQTKIERFIHDVALRKTMVRAHRQAWAWLDEWWGLGIDDIRNIERETQEALAKKYGGGEEEKLPLENEEANSNEAPDQLLETQINGNDLMDSPIAEESPRLSLSPRQKKDKSVEMLLGDDKKRESWSRSASKNTLSSHSQASWRMESIRRDSVSSESGDEFFDCRENVSETSSVLQKWSSLELLSNDADDSGPLRGGDSDQHDGPHRLLAKVGVVNTHPRLTFSGRHSEMSIPSSPNISPSHQPSPCPTTILILVVHAGSVLDAHSDITNKRNDFTTFRYSLESILRQHYPHLVGRVVSKLVPAPSICASSLNVISSLAPYGVDLNVGKESTYGEQVPVGALPILSIVTPEYQEALDKTIYDLNSTYQDFIHSEDGQGFIGQVCIIGDSVGGVLSYDALCRGSDLPSPGDDQGSTEHLNRKSYSTDPRQGSHDHVAANRSVSDSDCRYSASLNTTIPIPKVTPGIEVNNQKLEFEVSDLFLFGCPLAIVLVYRKMINPDDKAAGQVNRPHCHQVHNLFHPSDPLAVRLEPLLSARFSLMTPITIPRYSKYPLGDGQPTHLLECIQTHGNLFTSSAGSPSFGLNRRTSDASIISNVSGIADTVSISTINALSQRWWGNKRLDYALYCPEGLSNFPSNALPHLFHASYWESFDVLAFLIRQLGRVAHPAVNGDDRDISVFLNSQPREKWQKKRTSVKIKNIAANHRGNDMIVKGGFPQVIRGRFMYGPLDMVALSGEKVDVHVMLNPPAGDWKLLGTAVTDKSGRIAFPVPPTKTLGYGVYPVKLIVRGDHTTCSNYMAVVPPKTSCVVFSIDGSFTASVSVTGKDPKVRAGAVDVVRHWQELGYLILYITGRPDMQQQKVVSWLAQHNFPHGLVSFADGLSTDPLGHKAHYLQDVLHECEVMIEAAYGSAKDISVYSSLGLKPEQIFIVGKASKKQTANAQILTDGYAAHLAIISSPTISRPARCNPEMLIPKGFFGLPGQTSTLRRRRSAKRTSSYPVLGSQPNEGLLESKNFFGQLHRSSHKSMKS